MMNSEPDYEAALGLIKHLSSDELRELINNENKLMDLIKDLPQMKNLQSEREMLLASNKSLAEYNLSYEPKLSCEKQKLLSKYEESSNLQDDINNLNQQFDNSSFKKPPEDIQRLMKEAAQESEEDTEKMIKTFLNNVPPVDEFLDDFIPKRCKAHLRKIKSEKVTELLSSYKANSQTSLFQPPVITNPWSTPYPPNLPNMPMPAYSMP